IRYAADGVTAELKALELDIDGLALLSGTLRVRHMKLTDGRIELPPAQSTPAPWPERIMLPGELPALSLSPAIRIEALEIASLSLQRDGATLFTAHALSTRAALADGIVTVQNLRLEGAPVSLRLDARFDTAHGWDGTLDARADIALSPSNPV